MRIKIRKGGTYFSEKYGEGGEGDEQKTKTREDWLKKKLVRDLPQEERNNLKKRKTGENSLPALIERGGNPGGKKKTKD